jgi:hypothetical protein
MGNLWGSLGIIVMKTKSQEVAADVAALLRARNPLLWIVTREEARVERYLIEAAGAAGYLPRCALLVGVPGTGKSLTAKAIATAWGRTATAYRSWRPQIEICWRDLRVRAMVAKTRVLRPRPTRNNEPANFLRARFPDHNLRRRWLCVDCGTDTDKLSEYYSVTNKVWADAGMRADGGQLCIGCLEVRLGRKLYRSDFKKCPLNDGGLFPQSERLKERLTAEAVA